MTIVNPLGRSSIAARSETRRCERPPHMRHPTRNGMERAKSERAPRESIPDAGSSGVTLLVDFTLLAIDDSGTPVVI